MQLMKKRKILNSFISIGSFKNFLRELILLSDNKISSYVCICNVHMLVEAQKDNSFNELLNNADIATPDGMPVAKFLDFKYNYTQERVAGMDLLPAIIDECAKIKKSIYLYGSTNKVLKKIIKKINHNYPHLNVEFYSPPFRELSRQEEYEIIEKINAFNPDFVFVALGCPKQEKWMFAHKGKINSCMIGFGGAFTVYAGDQKRAPRWMRNNSLEWLHRLILEPKRLFVRYFITNSLFIWYICKDLLRKDTK